MDLHIMHIIVFQSPQIGKGEKTIDPANKAKVQEMLDWIEAMLTPSGFVAGTSKFTIADLSILGTITTLKITKDLYVDWTKVPKVVAWVEEMQKLVPNYEKSNDEGVKVFEAFFQRVTGLLE